MDSFEDVAELLDYPMFVVTTASNGRRAGCLVGFATQISIDPARFLVGLSVNNHTHQVAADASRLVVHLLDADSMDVARLFGEKTGDEVDKFAQCAWSPGPDGVPVLDEPPAWFSGTPGQTYWFWVTVRTNLGWTDANSSPSITLPGTLPKQQ